MSTMTQSFQHSLKDSWLHCGDWRCAPTLHCMMILQNSPWLWICEHPCLPVGRYCSLWLSLTAPNVLCAGRQAASMSQRAQPESAEVATRWEAWGTVSCPTSCYTRSVAATRNIEWVQISTFWCIWKHVWISQVWTNITMSKIRHAQSRSQWY